MKLNFLTSIVLTISNITLFFSTFSALAAAEHKIFTSVDSYSYSEPTSIDSFINKFNGDITNGEHAVSLSQIEFGFQKNNLTFSLIRRYDYLYEFSSDTARFYYQTENDVPFSGQQDYQLYLKASHFDASGVKLSYDWDVTPDINVTVAASYLEAKDFYQGKFSGPASWDSEDDFTVDAPGHIYSAHNLLLTYPETDATGKGTSADFSLGWNISEHWQFGLSVKDIWSKIKWQEALYSQVNRWEVHRLDEDGELDSRPLLEGATLNYQQKLPRRSKANLAYKTSSGITWYSQFFHSEYFLHKSIGVTLPFNEEHRFSMAWHIDAKAIELGYAMKFGHIRLMSDSSSSKEIKALALSANLSIPF